MASKEQKIAKFQGELLALGLDPVHAPVTYVANADGWPSLRGGRRKLLHLCRHGEAIHNVTSCGGAQCKCPKGSCDVQSQVFDAILTPNGEQQAHDMQQHLAKLTDVTCIVTSSHRRTLQTTVLGPCESIPGVPVKVTELCRERTGANWGDARSDKERLVHLVATSPHASRFDWEEVPTVDALFTSERESLQQLVDRVFQFLRYLRALPDDEIVVVSHSRFLVALLVCGVEKPGDLDEVRKTLCSYIPNATTRSLVVEWKA